MGGAAESALRDLCAAACVNSKGQLKSKAKLLTGFIKSQTKLLRTVGETGQRQNLSPGV